MKMNCLLKIFFSALGLVLLSGNLYAQTYTLPDTNFRNKLKTDLPFLMIGNDLNIPAANAYNSALNLSFSNISDASGIQFFINASSITLDNNILTTLPDISSLSKLVYLYASYNKLTSLPQLSGCTNLMDFQVKGNQLTSLPSLTGLNKLQSIYCQDNKLNSFPDLSTQTSLLVLDVGNNSNIKQLPDLSSLTTLKELHIHQTGIDTIIGLSNLSNLEILWAWGNSIRDLSALSANTKLKLFQVFNNELTSLPNLSNKASLYSINISNNKLTFEDILPLTSLPAFSTSTYIPQSMIVLPNYTVREKDNFSINLNIDLGISTNSYNWFKDGNLTGNTQTGIKNFPSVMVADSGSYYVTITNPGLPDLTLQTTIAHVTVKSCLELNSFTLNTVSENCATGSNINISPINIGGGTAPLKYAMIPVSTTDTVSSTSPDFQALASGIYRFVVMDSKMCQASKEVTIKKIPDCDPVITPNGDGIMDTYFIDGSGKAKIYDVGRNLVKELSIPALWDGTKFDGTPADAGYYAIVINGRRIQHITLVK